MTMVELYRYLLESAGKMPSDVSMAYKESEARESGSPTFVQSGQNSWKSMLCYHQADQRQTAPWSALSLMHKIIKGQSDAWKAALGRRK